MRLFAAKGFHAVSVDQIVAAAKINKRMVYHYFGSKEAIYQEALGEVFGRIEGVEFKAVETGSAEQKLAKLLDAYFTFLDDNPEFVQMLQWENLERGKHLGKQHPGVTKNPFMERFRAIVDEGVAAGQFRRNLNVTHLMIHFIGLSFIYFSNRYSLAVSMGIDLDSAAEMNTARRQVLALVFDGIRVDKGGRD